MKKAEVKNNSFNKYPFIEVSGDVVCGWEEIKTSLFDGRNITITVDCYQGVFIEEIEKALGSQALFVRTEEFFKPEEEILSLTQRDVTDDEVFGVITHLKMKDFLDEKKVEAVKEKLSGKSENIIVCGPGASLFLENPDVRVYADMARWEIQKRMKNGLVNGLGVVNNSEPFNHQYKRGFFVDWKVCDRHKKEWFSHCDYLLDTNNSDSPKLVEMSVIGNGLRRAARRPFSVVPFFDPGVWGGHWMEQKLDLENKEAPNHAWCFNCIPEENSILFKIDGKLIELPSVDLVFFESVSLLGDAVEARFGKEFPIRFDFLDTMGGGNLSLQVHPDTTYIQENFGMHYTQDESYYLLDAGDSGTVYLGLKEDADVDKMFTGLVKAQEEGDPFDAEEYVNTYPAKKHDHFLIPAGTIHCSGKDSMVLEISSTPYIFTFKMWDWGRLGLDGKPRPINIGHAQNVVNAERRSRFVEKELINRFEVVKEGEGWMEEKTGLHEREFIETRRHWFSEPVLHEANGSVNVLMLVDGEEAVVESPESLFEPFVVHYAEAFIVPASVKSYTISPCGSSQGKRIATIKAYVRI
ncbi:class I mannose-6-phosphate isomerase [Marinilabilia salmonicolor]|uniref:class I mannose-6-phosphate isomerase n=1 Tax=Marinilabilia salmonicolor TaxID=989 RepID=UPI00029A78BA|nr:class I mannose-6-phosphate isomerase [Marinilabilia salmonicolor]